jgi:hypothetical protein
LDDLDFSYLDVFDWINSGNFLGDLLFNDFTGEKLQDLSGVGFRNFFGDNVIHSLSDNLLLGGKSIVGLSLLVVGLSSEGNGENSDDVSVGRFTILDCFDECLSFFN